MSDNIQVKEILQSIGYNPKINGKNYQCVPLYRESDSAVLFVNKHNGLWYDFKDCIGGELKDLVRMTTGKSDNESQKFLDSNNFVTSIPKDGDETGEDLGYRTFPKEWLSKLEKNHYYWKKRGISESSTAEFMGGVAKDGRMYMRYVFPIFNERGEIIGFSGRDILNVSKRVKWKILGPKKNFCYPAYFNFNTLINDKEIILVESIGDMLRLWDSGIKNTLVLFGVNINPITIKTILKADPNRIVIALNDDSNNSNAGNKASEKIRRKLLEYFDPEKVVIHLPEGANDFGDMTDEQIKSWKKNLSGSQPQE